MFPASWETLLAHKQGQGFGTRKVLASGRTHIFGVDVRPMAEKQFYKSLRHGHGASARDTDDSLGTDRRDLLVILARNGQQRVPLLIGLLHQARVNFNKLLRFPGKQSARSRAGQTIGPPPFVDSLEPIMLDMVPHSHEQILPTTNHLRFSASWRCACRPRPLR